MDKGKKLILDSLTANFASQSEALAWCEARQTDVLVGAAIHEIAGESREAHRVWENPTEDELNYVASRCRELIGPGHTLCWGEEKVQT